MHMGRCGMGGLLTRSVPCPSSRLSTQAQFEMPYVVRLHNFHQLAPPQPCFSFHHPNSGRSPQPRSS